MTPCISMIASLQYLPLQDKHPGIRAFNPRCSDAYLKLPGMGIRFGETDLFTKLDSKFHALHYQYYCFPTLKRQHHALWSSTSACLSQCPIITTCISHKPIYLPHVVALPEFRATGNPYSRSPRRVLRNRRYSSAMNLDSSLAHVRTRQIKQI